MRLDPKTKTEASRLAEELAHLVGSGLALPGSLTHRYSRCGRSGCKCGADPPQPHGPYWSWTRKIDNKTVTRYLSEDQHRDYQALFDNARRLRELVTALEALGLGVVEADPRWSRSRSGSAQH